MKIRGLIPLLCTLAAPCSVTAQVPAKETNCCDRIDNDGDGLIDFRDIDCATHMECPCEREKDYELVFAGDSKFSQLTEGVLRDAFSKHFVIGIRNRTGLRAVQFDVVRTLTKGEHIYNFEGTHRDGAGNPVPTFQLEDGTMVVPDRPNRLATSRQILFIEPGRALAQARAEFLTLDMDPRDIDGFRVAYDAKDAGPEGVFPRGDREGACIGLQFLRLELETEANRPFLRGDSDADGSRGLTDAIHVLEWIFRRGESPPCLQAADVNDDDRINILDPILLLQWLFVEAPDRPPGPWWRCGGDVTDGRLSCETGCRT
jgi:hypothetical protein